MKPLTTQDLDASDAAEEAFTRTSVKSCRPFMSKVSLCEWAARLGRAHVLITSPSHLRTNRHQWATTVTSVFTSRRNSKQDHGTPTRSWQALSEESCSQARFTCQSCERLEWELGLWSGILSNLPTRASRRPWILLRSEYVLLTSRRYIGHAEVLSRTGPKTFCAH